MARNPSAGGVDPIDEHSPECAVCLSHAIMCTLDGCTHKFCMGCAVRNSTYHNNRDAFCPICRGQYTTVTQDDNNLTFKVSGKFKVPGFPWVSAFCMGLANNIRLETSDDQIDVYMPEYLNNMIGCKANVYWVLQADDQIEPGNSSEEMEQRLCAIEDALPAWILLPDIYPKLVVAKHIERMVKDGLMEKYPLPTDTTSIEERANDLPYENTEDGGAEFTIAIIYLTNP